MSPILFYDGTCGFCARSVQWVLAHERADHTLRFATLQGQRASEALAMHPELEPVDSVVWYDAQRTAHSAEPSLILVKSDAVLRIWRYVGGPWRMAAALGRIVPRPLRDRLYDLVARHRHRLASGAACLVPTESQRGRFMDLS